MVRISGKRHANEEIPDEHRFNAIWEEVERTRRMLETLYNNLQLSSGTNVFKKTVILKDQDDQPAMEVTSVIMTRKMRPSFVDESIKSRYVTRSQTKRCHPDTN